MFDERKKDQIWTAHELELEGAFDGMDNADLQRVLHTGELTIKRINKAMRDIDQVVLKKLGEEAIENPRIYESVNGKMLHGFEIIKVFQKPSENTLKNTLHLAKGTLILITSEGGTYDFTAYSDADYIPQNQTAKAAPGVYYHAERLPFRSPGLQSRKPEQHNLVRV